MEEFLEKIPGSELCEIERTDVDFAKKRRKEVDKSSDFLIRKWKEPGSHLLANYLPPAVGTVKTIVDENGRMFDLVPRRRKLELEAWRSIPKDTRQDPHKHSSYTPSSICPAPPCIPLEFSKLDELFADKEMRILMVGLNGAGKTTILEKISNLGLGDIVTTTPTLGFIVETLEYKNISFTAWDLGGEDKVRALWRHYYHNIQGIIFVLDSSDHSRVDEARDELHRILNEDELKDAVLLLYANKCEVMGKMHGIEIVNKLDLISLFQRQCQCQRQRRIWTIEPICANLGLQIYSGLYWLSENIANKAKTGETSTDYWGV